MTTTPATPAPAPEPARLVGYVDVGHSWGITGELLVMIYPTGETEVALRPEGVRRWLPPVEVVPLHDR